MNKIIELELYENIPECTDLSNITSIEIKDGYEWDGHAYAFCVGIVLDDGTVESYFKTDKNNENTNLFDKLRRDINMIEKHECVIDRKTGKKKSGNRYFVPYRVKNHCSEKPTITDFYVDGCSNVHYSVEYEILLVAGDGYKKYITVEYETEGSYSSCFWDHVEQIEIFFEEWFEKGLNGFRIVEDNYKTVAFYNDIGDKCDIDIFSISELMTMITSIRVIKCDQTIIS